MIKVEWNMLPNDKSNKEHHWIVVLTVLSHYIIIQHNKMPNLKLSHRCHIFTTKTLQV